MLVWSKIYKKSIIIENQIKFPQDKMWEDVYFNYLTLLFVNKIVYLENYVGYIRHVQENSITRTAKYNKIRGTLDVFHDLYNNYYKYHENIDFSWLLAGSIEFYIGNVSSLDILHDKEEVYNFLDYLYSLEKETSFNDSYLNIVFRVPNKLIMKKQFKLAILYFNITRNLYKNQSLRKLYRFFQK